MTYTAKAGVCSQILLLQTKRNLLYIRNQSYRAVNTFHHGYKNQPVNEVQSKGRSLFSDPPFTD
jgi:hypothetical protein